MTDSKEKQKINIIPCKICVVESHTCVFVKESGVLVYFTKLVSSDNKGKVASIKSSNFVPGLGLRAFLQHL